MASLATRPSLHKGPVGSLRDRCAQCLVVRPRLMLCTGCRAVRYCSREHQVQHRPEHKSDCTGIKKERARVALEEDLVRNQAEDFMTPANAFETHVGHFYGILETRVYIRARFIMADHLRLMGTPDGVGEAADHMLDILRLNRSDNLGVRDFVPAVLLRLDRDQQAYDMIKWWATCDPDGHYDWGDMSLPYMNLKGENVLEDPQFLSKSYRDLSHLVTVLLLKMKLIVDIRSIKAARWVLSHNSPLPAELRLAIEPDVVRSPLSKTLFAGKPNRELVAIERQLTGHATKLCSAIFECNPSFFQLIFDPDHALVMHPPSYSPGSYEHAALTLQQTFAAIWETAGVLEIIQNARSIAGKTLFERTTFWKFLDWAVQDASYLGSWSKRPSNGYAKKHHLKTAKHRQEVEGEDEDEWMDTGGSSEDDE